MNSYPARNRYNKTQFLNDINAFTRKIKIQAHFKNTEQNLDDEQFRVSCNKMWTPKDNHHTVETFKQAFQNDLEKEKQTLKQIPPSSLPKKEKNALKTLREREDIFITKADKGGAVVIIGADDYIKEAN